MNFYRIFPFRRIAMAILAIAACMGLILCTRAQGEGSEVNKTTIVMGQTGNDQRQPDAFALRAKQISSGKCRPAVIPVEGEPPSKILIEPPLAEPLASRGVVVIQYCTENLHIVPVFGAKALAVTPRVGHLHVRVDDSAWVWAEASGNPIILLGLAPGPHKVSLELVNANHQPLDKAEVTFVIPKLSATGTSSEKAKSREAGFRKAMKAKSAAPLAIRQTATPHHHPE